MRRGGSGDENGLEEVIPSTGVAPSFAERPHSLPKYGDRQGVRLSRALSRPALFRLTGQDLNDPGNRIFFIGRRAGLDLEKISAGEAGVFYDCCAVPLAVFPDSLMTTRQRPVPSGAPFAAAFWEKVWACARGLVEFLQQVKDLTHCQFGHSAHLGLCVLRKFTVVVLVRCGQLGF